MILVSTKRGWDMKGSGIVTLRVWLLSFWFVEQMGNSVNANISDMWETAVITTKNSRRKNRRILLNLIWMRGSMAIEVEDDKSQKRPCQGLDKRNFSIFLGQLHRGQSPRLSFIREAEWMKQGLQVQADLQEGWAPPLGPAGWQRCVCV